ncbi:hypothetical protein [Kitasatospora kifunensis]|uniref:Secreted protein n=1 Tax=Kitasatospora kifunensis TaxID=58351 RepID=A0A7W7QXC4_KITKI|nr:hypothetical protein [Kitasatospora kifunensis]MBB4921444.1 hypothetical protein [Kitasatospora kifunensis]
MGRKLTALTGIIVASLAFGLGTAAETVHPHQSTARRVLAEDKGPTIISAATPQTR